MADPFSEDERQPTVKICDFTVACLIPSSVKDPDTFKLSQKAGTQAFNAPELFSQAAYLAKPLDVWAFGVCIYVYLNN